ncbi:MAG: hypothetical protein LUH36_07960 [Oscillospiraceae bacterium]|nr:hypothetical protein [Oscillospiraceae bacterium]
MGNTLYLMSGKKALPAKEYHYEYEDELQQLIENNPHLLFGTSEGTELILVQREFTVSDDFGMSLDHLFVDENGVPVLVEVKRAVDTRIRREVVAQVLDYASCAAAWDANLLRQLFQETNSDNEDILERYDTDEFWDTVATNLRAERLILAFAADKIPTRLKNILEFLNRNMNGIQVYGVEIRQFQTNDSSLLSSNIVTSLPVDTDQAAPSVKRRWSAKTMLEYTAEACGRSVADVCEALIHYASQLDFNNKFGSNTVRPSFLSKRPDGYWFFQIYFNSPSEPVLSLYIENFTSHLNNGPTVDELTSIFTDKLCFESQYLHLSNKYVNIDLIAFTDPSTLNAFMDVMTELMQKGGIFQVV